APIRSASAGTESGVKLADSLPAGAAAAGGTFTATGLEGSGPTGARKARSRTGTTLVEVLRDAASDASSILAASTSRPESAPRRVALRARRASRAFARKRRQGAGKLLTARLGESEGTEERRELRLVAAARALLDLEGIPVVLQDHD